MRRKLATTSAVDPIDRACMNLRATVLPIMAKMASAEWLRLIAALRDEIGDIEKIKPSTLG